MVSYATRKKKVHFLKCVCNESAVPLPKPPIEFTKERTTISLPAYVFNAVLALQEIRGTGIDFSGILQEAIIAYAQNHHPDLLDGIKADIRSGKIKVSGRLPKKKDMASHSPSEAANPILQPFQEEGDNHGKTLRAARGAGKRGGNQ